MNEKGSVEAIAAAWRLAGKELGIRVGAPYTLKTASGYVRFPAYLPDFGGPRGMVICDLGWHPMHDDEQVSAASAAGLYYSSVNPSSYSVFDRALFVDTLNDWGYFGPQKKTPPWYSGLAWGESSASRPMNAYLSNRLGLKIIVPDVLPPDEPKPQLIRRRDGSTQPIPDGFTVVFGPEPPEGWVIADE